MPPLKAVIFKVLFFLIFLISFASCGKKSQRENAIKKESFTDTKKDEIETSFFIEMANAMYSMISKSHIAQQKSSENKILEISKKIENHQTQLLQKVTEMANKKLIIITELNVAHKEEIYNLSNQNGNDFNKAYLNAMATSLTQQIKLFEKISKETNDELILKVVLQYLPEQYQLLRETEQIKSEFN